MSETTPEAPAATSAPEQTCKWDGCNAPREPKDPSKRGPAPSYCTREDHNPGAAWRRTRAAKSASNGAPDEPETDKPVTDAAAESVNVREDVVRLLQQLPESLERYVGLLQTINDPEAAEAQVMSVESEANTRIATAQARADAERTAKIAAVKAKEAAVEEKAAADAAADHMAKELEDAAKTHAAEVVRIQEAANADVRKARDQEEQKRLESERLVEEAGEKAAAEVKTVKDRAAADIAEVEKLAKTAIKKAQDEAGKREVAAAKTVEDMTATLKKERADAAKQVDEANKKTAAAEKRAGDAEQVAQQARQDADARVKAEKSAAETVRSGLVAELERANDALASRDERVKELDARVDELRREVDAKKDELRTADDRTRVAVAAALKERDAADPQ
ncbi:hypothetical protein [Streptomyces anulatus]|uniref:hypothetical protein n=1 Tax=Streptomyces anulatus TaxID=1892 RepID=UPI00364DCCC0